MTGSNQKKQRILQIDYLLSSANPPRTREDLAREMGTTLPKIQHFFESCSNTRSEVYKTSQKRNSNETYQRLGDIAQALSRLLGRNVSMREILNESPTDDLV